MTRPALWPAVTLFCFACGGDGGGEGGAATSSSSSSSTSSAASSSSTSSSSSSSASSSSSSSSTSSSSASSSSSSSSSSSGGYALRFEGNGTGDIDRVKIPIDEPPPDSTPGPPADVGAADFTIEVWIRASGADNPAPAVSCGANVDWITGNIFIDRDRYNQDRKFGVSLAGGRVVFGVSGDGTGDRTLCGTSPVLDGDWHHVAVERRRSDGRMWVFIDGHLDATVIGPLGDISYPDDGVPGSFCGGPCTGSDPFLVLGAEKHDAGSAYPPYRGLMDELRISTSIRYLVDFTPPSAPFTPDAATAALYHFDEGQGDVVGDSSGALGGPSHGVRKLGGSPPGPSWVPGGPF